MQIHRELQ